ncbi:hypothetical protein GFGA_1c0661 [Gluconobacter frateurii NBRC 103465]|nr:hypothetical protein GFGA_1c0661 [Gluconobacter frateurii NBRC 103465]
MPMPSKLLKQTSVWLTPQQIHWKQQNRASRFGQKAPSCGTPAGNGARRRTHPSPFPRPAPAPRYTRTFQSDVFPFTARSVTDTPSKEPPFLHGLPDFSDGFVRSPFSSGRSTNDQDCTSGHHNGSALRAGSTTAPECSERPQAA